MNLNGSTPEMANTVSADDLGVYDAVPSADGTMN